MTSRIKELLTFIREEKHHGYRQNVEFAPPETYKARKLSPTERVTESFCQVLREEKPVVIEGERILFWRTVKNLPELFTQDEKENLLHESGRVNNISPNYEDAVARGLLFSRKQAAQAMMATDQAKQEFYIAVIRSIDAVLELTERYRQAALAAGNTGAAKILERVPAYGARTFPEALQSFRIIHYALWCEGEFHNTLGRFDQYMAPYLEADLQNGSLTEEEAQEWLEEFFLSLNRDSDLYFGVQQGDNGQSMMLGGVDREGKPCFNRLSRMCLEASRELKLIDPKLNLRVNGETPLDIYELGTELTKEGLGFPQYANDDVVIPGLVEKGYALEDARDYTVAACWEFIIPKVGMDVPNIAAVNFPELVNAAVKEDLAEASSYEDFFSSVCRRIERCCRELAEGTNGYRMLPAPYMSVLMSGCIERGEDISMGNHYNNYGFHGVGISTAVDSLYTIKRTVFEEESMTPEQAKDLVLGEEMEAELLAHLRYGIPKFGDNVDEVDEVAVALLAAFGKAMEPLRNDRGGCFRGGTGSAMFYLWYADHVENALSGHRKGEAFSANYAPELFVRNKGPLSVIQSFTKPDLKKVINGGPLTMEFHSTLFRDKDSIRKVAGLVQGFIRSGGHQLQLNSVNKGTLLDAQRHPEMYKNLIVRIWGWSAYFTELDREYQDHVIARQEFTL